MAWKSTLVAAVLLLLAGCTLPTTAPDNAKGPEPSPPPSPRVSLDVFAAAGITATRVVPNLGGGRYLPPYPDASGLVAVGTTLIARTVDGENQALLLARSADFGQTWKHIQLPEQPGEILAIDLAEAGARAVAFSNVDPDSAWVTDDGVTWRGGPVPVNPDGAMLPRPVLRSDGQLAVGVQGREVERLVVTADGGATWKVVGCPSAPRPGALAGKCEVERPVGGNLLVRAHEVSADNGQTWRPTVFATASPSAMPPTLGDVMPLSTGGWLGSVVTLPGTSTTADLARSADGVVWEPVVRNPCGSSSHGSIVSKPRSIRQQWIVTINCLGADDDPVSSTLYLVDRDGATAKPLATIDRPGAWFGAPVGVGPVVVVPEVNSGHVTPDGVTFLHLRLG